MKTINFLFFLILLIGSPGLINASQNQPIPSIQKAIQQYIASNLPKDTDYEIKLGKIDRRLLLPLCSEPLSLFIHNSALRPGRNSIGIKCSTKKPWTIYTSIVVNIYEQVLVLSQAINRGEILTQKNIKFEKRNISSLRSGFLTDPQRIINKQATRNLRAGLVLKQSNFIQARLVKRGDKVNIKVVSPNLNISMVGISMMDGIQGQHIRVKNVTSKQIVQATVVRPGLVEVMF